MRFFLIDQSLYDAGGHNLDYARHVAQCATSQGWQIAIFGHKNLDAIQTFPDISDALHPTFTQGAREGATLGVRLTASALARLERLNPPIKIPRFEPLYPRARRFLHDLIPVLRSQRPTPGDKLFFPNPSWADLTLIAENLKDHIDLTGVELHAVLRFDPPTTPESLERLKQALRTDDSKIKLWADTAELSEIYFKNLDHEINLLSIPVLNLENKTTPNHIRVSFLGESRIDKGFHLLPSFIDGFMKSNSDSRYSFFIQILNDPNKNQNILKSIHELEQHENKNIVLHKGAMDSQLYKEAIEKSDIILCLHEPEQYKHRSAGIVTQAASSGIPIVMKDGPSSPRSMIFRNGCEDMVRFCDNQPENIAKAVRSAAEIPKRRPRILDCVDLWSAPWKSLGAR